MEITSNLFETFWPLRNAEPAETLKEIQEGRVVGIVKSDTGKFVYKVADPWKTKEAVARDLSAFELLPLDGFNHIPSLLKTRTGESFAEIGGKYIYVMEYIDGITPEANAGTYARLGTVTAKLHSIQNYPYETDFYPAPIIAKDLIMIAEKLPFKDEYLAIVRDLPSFEKLPHALIHSDIAPGNAILRPNGDMVLVDWDDV